MTGGVGVLRCPSCGAPAEPRAAACAHCAAKLHPIRCPWCFGWTFTEARDCAHCGSLAETAPGPAPSCPGCRAPLTTRRLGAARLSGCEGCGGVWTDPDSFRSICEDREARAAYLGDGSILSRPSVADPHSAPVVYRPCAVCSELMNRVNFANCSGVILDVCKPHGVWFDPDELRRIVAFIRGGGMDVARANELRKLEAERRRLVQANEEAKLGDAVIRIQTHVSVGSARDLLRLLSKTPFEP